MTLNVAMTIGNQHQMHTPFKKSNKLDFAKIKTSAPLITMLRELEDKPQIGRKCLQKTYPIKD